MEVTIKKYDITIKLQQTMTDSKFSTKAARVIASQLYVAKGLKKNPAQHIKFMRTNSEYFANITPEMLDQLQKEYNLSDSDIEGQPEVKFADLCAEDRFEEELLKKAEAINKDRRERKKRDSEKSSENSKDK